MLTDIKCRTAKVEGGKEKKISDGLGLYLLVKPNGANSGTWPIDSTLARKSFHSGFMALTIKTESLSPPRAKSATTPRH
jgi:hypothetical protein